MIWTNTNKRKNIAKRTGKRDEPARPLPAVHTPERVRLHPAWSIFLTINAFQHEEIFGTVGSNEEMQLSSLGIIIQTEWFRSAEIRKEIRLFEDEFVVKPNHIHGIVWIVGNEIVGADGVRHDIRPGEQSRTAFPGTYGEDATHAGGAYHAPLRRAPRSLSSFIAGFKAAVTSRAGRELNAANIWQRNYYEHIVRSKNEFMNFWNYRHQSQSLAGRPIAPGRAAKPIQPG